MATVFVDKGIHKRIAEMTSRGGQYQKAADKCKQLIYDVREKGDPMKALGNYPVTNHGENRIKHCVKYDFPGFSRLVTIQDNGWLVLIYFGTHDEVDRWLDNNRGLRVAITDPDKGLFDVYISEDISDKEKRVNPEVDYSSSLLFDKLKHYWEHIKNELPSYLRKGLEQLETTCAEEEILEIATAINDVELQETVFDVFMALRGGLVDEAKNRILTFQEKLTPIDEVPTDMVQQIGSNDQYINLDSLEPEDMHILMSNKSWLEWMLFMHPAQKQVVDRDFSGSARLLGVSGSGKTCIIVRRAVRLARKYQGQKILILTLNQSLAGLIAQLVDHLLECRDSKEMREFIEVKSFWELCRELLIEYRNEPFDTKILGSKTHKHDESIEEVWEEYYHCENNNHDAEVFMPIHQTLLARDVYPLQYLKQELDWIRSFLSKENRLEYLKVQRENRAVQFVEQDREWVLQGLEGWENKMAAVGAIDYLGLANELYPYMDIIESKYRCIMVDEIQDFGTLELSIIRKLVDKNENDLFLCGDIAQQVYNKHHKIVSAGITILPDAYMKILKNYRNSREILAASYAVFENNVDESKLKSEDFEVLNPEYANFSSPKPFLRKTESLKQEFLYALTYLNDILEDKEKGCIAICDFSIFEIEKLSEAFNLPILNGSTKLGKDKIYLSDLEQTKGFEFDRMIVINTTDGVFPNPKLPVEERFREISKFYVAMTRAKKELIISHSQQPSYLFDNCKEYFTEDDWLFHIPVPPELQELPLKTKQHLSRKARSVMTGKKFLYHRKAVGISRELQTKLINLVDGSSMHEMGKKVRWRNMDELKTDIVSGRDKPHHTKLWGPTVYTELSDLLNADV